MLYKNFIAPDAIYSQPIPCRAFNIELGIIYYSLVHHILLKSQDRVLSCIIINHILPRQTLFTW